MKPIYLKSKIKSPFSNFHSTENFKTTSIESEISKRKGSSISVGKNLQTGGLGEACEIIPRQTFVPAAPRECSPGQ
jgi:hypothetical protein